MGFFRRIAAILGFVKDDSHVVNDQDDDDNANAQSRNRVHVQETGLPRKGFSVPAQVVVERPHKLGPVLVPSDSGDCGVQGLGWYTKRLKMDDDGDVADEFFEEETLPCVDNPKALSRFKVKCSTRPVKVQKQVMSLDGTIQQCVEHQGKLQWI